MSEKMITIAVDTEVFRYLQSKANAFVDRPNDVLRRLLLGDFPDRDPGLDTALNVPVPNPEVSKVKTERSEMQKPADVKAFVHALLKQEFGPQHFRTKDNYRLMFINGDALIYVQNFDKRADHLWYRVNAKPWLDLQEFSKAAWVCFTNPPTKIAYKIPVKAIIDRARASGWERDYLEVNIDPNVSRWIELDWKIENYRIIVSVDSEEAA
jgi:hypothetical protein